MADLKKFQIGERVTEFPARTWNALVNGEIRDRNRTPDPGAILSAEPWSPVRAWIRNDTETAIPVGGVLKIDSVLVEPSSNKNTVFDGIQFKGATPAADEPHVVILIEPVKPNFGGWGVIPGAAWAKVNVSDAGHKFAKPKASVAELESGGSGYPIIWKESGTGAGKWAVVSLVKSTVVTVFEFRSCDDPEKRLFIDNAEIAQHEADEVAIINRDESYECWRLYGPAPFCKTGECALIVGWKSECFNCYYLTPCGGGSPTFVRERTCGEWSRYVGKVVKLDGPGHEGCYTVAEATGCSGINEELTSEHIVSTYVDCAGCGCYMLEPCGTEDAIYIDNDLREVTGDEEPDDVLGKIIKYMGVCYEVKGFGNPCGTTPQHWDYDWTLCDIFGGGPQCPELVETCSACCYLLTPCEGQAGDPEPAYYRPEPSDPDLTEFVDGNVSNGRVLRLADDICYTVSIPETCPEEDVTVGLGTVKEEYDSCEDCKITCWERCDAPGTFIRTYSDMSEVPLTGAAVKRAEDGKCYTYESSPGTCGTPAIVEFTIEEIVEHASACTVCQTPKVKLVPSCGSNCSGCEGGGGGGSPAGTAIVTNNSAFFEGVGKYFKVDGKCMLAEWTTDALAGSIGCYSGPYNSCAACAAAPSRLKVLARGEDGDMVVEIEGSFNVCSETPLSECD